MLASAATVSGMVLLLSLKPHTSPTVVTAQTRSPSSAGSSASPGATASGSRSVTGGPVQTRWGPVQVRITLKDGRLTDVTALDYPQDNPRDQEINSYALPQLRREALTAQSARIDTVSGATYTSDGYRRSLQSALDSAGL
ncbi:FMN-binding protein [Streptomyces lucensis JCM 4490]|uniref:FMN-binding protein n=1 Tax=Streptomyces lucensis JCM 4490 TaxID=1306176 RepID=A0A918MQA9_9ACTN|nr:FMN-binding protein [Streptomyces lucensis JCM 4490]